MPDQTTPITDDDRLAHEWARMAANNAADPADAPWKIVARVFLETVPAPPKSLADELRELADDTVASGMFGSMTSRLTRLADRVEAVEKELAATYSENERVHSTLATVTDERDEARAEVERLQGTVASQENVAPTLTDLADALRGSTVRNDPPDPADVPPGMYELDRDLPEPADVPKGELWLIRAHGWGGLRVGARNDAEERPAEPWHWMDVDQHGKGQCGDRHVTLVARLVPDTRRVIDTVEDLDALPVGTVVLADGKPAVKHVRDRWWIDGVYVSASDLVTYYGTVSVLHVPDATA